MPKPSTYKMTNAVKFVWNVAISRRIIPTKLAEKRILKQVRVKLRQTYIFGCIIYAS